MTYDHLILHGLDVIRKVAQGQDLPTTNIVQGDSITFTQSYYGGIVSVTKNMRKFDLYDQIESVVRSAADDAFHKIDQSMADLLGFGFSSGNYTDVYTESVTATGPDGLALFSASHTNNINANTFRNIIRFNAANNPVLSREAVVKARIDAYENTSQLIKNHMKYIRQNKRRWAYNYKDKDQVTTKEKIRSLWYEEWPDECNK